MDVYDQQKFYQLPDLLTWASLINSKANQLTDLQLSALIFFKGDLNSSKMFNRRLLSFGSAAS
jgi:hypothetical protein